jgi:hypothetical protein
MFNFVYHLQFVFIFHLGRVDVNPEKVGKCQVKPKREYQKANYKSVPVP